MAPRGECLPRTMSNSNMSNEPPRLSSSSSSSSSSHDHQYHIQRTFSDISFELAKEGMDKLTSSSLVAISEVEDAKCECCGMSEECTAEYIERVRCKFLGKFVCGLCSEAVKEELEKNGGNKSKEEALSAHMNACVRFNKYGRAFPVLFQAEAMKEMLKKSKMDGTRRVKSFKSIRDNNNNNNNNGGPKKGGIARSSSCIPAITREINDLTLAN